MEHKGNKWEGKTSQFKKRRKKRRKDGDIIFDNAVMAEEESDYIIKDEKGNIVHPDNRMALLFHPDYKCYLQKKDN